MRLIKPCHCMALVLAPLVLSMVDKGLPEQGGTYCGSRNGFHRSAGSKGDGAQHLPPKQQIPRFELEFALKVLKVRLHLPLEQTLDLVLVTFHISVLQAIDVLTYFLEILPPQFPEE